MISSCEIYSVVFVCKKISQSLLDKCREPLETLVKESAIKG